MPTPLERLLAAEIAAGGPISFRRFMEAALYHPEHGYYRCGRDPFGAGGDYYTAGQIQPVFGILMASLVRSLLAKLERPAGAVVVDLGAGRREMSDAFCEFRYVPVEIGAGRLPQRFRGVVFANEFFDALPVFVAARRGGRFVERRVGGSESGFYWVDGDEARQELRAYLDKYARPGPEGAVFEANLDALAWLERIAGSLEEGFLVAIDYGYTRKELDRFPAGTLMSYSRHLALEDVLAGPGRRDITAHVPFTALMEHGAGLGMETERLESLTMTLIGEGEAGQFARALAGRTEEERRKRTRQLQTLIAMGETFRTLILRAHARRGALLK